MRGDITQGMWDRMPKAVKDHIERLERRLQERDTTIRELKTIGDRDTEKGIIIDPYDEYPQVVAADRTIRFWIEPGKFAIDCSMRAALTSRIPHALNVSGYGLRTTGLIAIAPTAGNVVNVFREDG